MLPTDSAMRTVLHKRVLSEQPGQDVVLDGVDSDVDGESEEGDDVEQEDEKLLLVGCS